MELKNLQLNEIFNFAELKNLFKHFSITTGLDVTLYDNQGKEQLSYRTENSICIFSGDNLKCSENIKYGGEKAKELGQPYIFACACGLIMCSSPIVFNDELIGSIVCGPVMLWEVDDFAVTEFDNKLKELGIIHNNFDVTKIKQLSCTNMTSAAQILYILVNYIVNEEQKNLKQRLEIIKQKETIFKLIEQKENSVSDKVSLKKYPAELEKKLITFVRLGEKNKAKEVINNYLGEIFYYAKGEMDIIKSNLYELTAFLSRAAVEAGAPLESMMNSIKNASNIFKENIEFNDLCLIIIDILYDFIDKVYENRSKKQSSEHLLKALEYINEHFAENISLENLSKAVFVSPYYLSHLFRDEMNTTFSDYLNKIRIEEAKKLLKTTALRVENISESVGFNNSNYFIKIFKKLTGLSPMQYKKNIKL